MSDRPKPGKDKDLRLIRQAIDETDKFYGLLAAEIDVAQMPDFLSFISEAMLVTIDQLDFLHQMLDDAMLMPDAVIEYNRCLRGTLRLMMQHKRSQAELVQVTRMIQAAGDQLKSLLIVKDIRANP